MPKLQYTLNWISTLSPYRTLSYTYDTLTELIEAANSSGITYYSIDKELIEE